MTGVQTCALPICFPVTIDSEFVIAQNLDYNFPSNQGLKPINDLQQFFYTSTNAPSLPFTTRRLRIPKRSINAFKLDPNVFSPRFFRYSLYLTISRQSGGNVPTGAYKLFNVRWLTLKTSVLDEYAKSFIRIPTTYPATIKTINDLGVAQVARLKNKNNQDVLTSIKRIGYVISRKEGLKLTYSCDYDESRDDNILLQRISKRDDQAVNTAVTA